MSQLSATQSEILERLLRRKSEKTAVDFPRVAPGERVALLPAQARLWYFCRRYPESAEYNLFDAVTFAKGPDRELLRDSIRTLTERHDALRLRIVEVDGVPMQEDCGPVEPPITWHDLRELDGESARSSAERIVQEAAARPLPMDRAPLFRVLALLMPDGRTTLVLGFHHVIIDHWSVGRVLDELARLLAGEVLPAAHDVRYLDYAAARARNPDGGRQERELEYWKRKLGGVLPVLDLPTDRPRPAVPTRRGGLVGFTAGAQTAGRVRDFTEREGATMFVVLLAAYQVLLSRLTGQTDILVGSPLAGRDDETAEKITGCFVKPVALRADLAGSPSFRTLVRQVRQTVLEAQDHQTVPFERVVAELGAAGTAGGNPVFQTIFGFQEGIRVETAGDGGSLATLDTRSARTDLTVSVTYEGDGFRGVFEYFSDVFDRSTIERFTRMYLTLLDDLLAAPETPIGTARLLTDAERDRVLHGLNGYARPDFRYRTLAEPFEEQVLRTPEAVALIGEEGELTYAELNARANQLAHHLAELGVRPGDQVAVCLERGFPLVISLYAVAKAGAAYVPIDPELPDGRMDFMLDDTRPRLVIADGRPADRFAEGPWRVLRLTGTERPWERCPTGNPPATLPASTPAYLLYTSGSSGRPKAVTYPADGALANILWYQGAYPFGPGDAAILKTSFGFDVSIWELFWPLYYGARLVVARPGGHRDPEYLLRLVEQHGVTTLFFVSTMLEVFLDNVPAGSCRSLRRVLVGGEEVKPRLRDAFHAHFAAELVNNCGPTETGTVVEGVIPREPGSPVVPLGRPCDNFRIYVLGPDLEVLPIGVPGEMYVGGEIGLAHGYHDRPSLTAERFLPDPFGAAGERMYRTGDLCRLRQDGLVEHLGRIDRQVKIRGLRVELSEIESVLCDRPDVRACAALAPRELDGRIAAFVVTEPGYDPSGEELQRHARQLLPTHMVPAAVVAVDEIPYTVNGKIDEKALLARLGSPVVGGSTEQVEPENEMEARLAAVFRDVLGLESIGVTDSFFSLGGHSLLVFKLIAACDTRIGIRLTVGDVFAAPSVRELADRLGSGGERKDEVLVPLAAAHGGPVIVFVHGAGGSVLPFRAVASALSAQYDVYGLQALDDPDGPAPSVEDMAARYATAVDAVRGPRPLLLVGWSVGGCVALEMARQWQGHGVDVVGTVLLDSWLPPSAIADPNAAAQAREAFRVMDVLPQVAETRMSALAEQHRAAFLRYAPKPYTGEVRLLRAAEPYVDTRAGLPELLQREDHGWRERISGLSLREIPGDHFTLMSDQNAAPLSGAIREILDELIEFDEI